MNFVTFIVIICLFIANIHVCGSAEESMRNAKIATGVEKPFMTGGGNKYGSSLNVGIPIYKSNNFDVGASVGRAGGWKSGTGTWSGGVGIRFKF